MKLSSLTSLPSLLLLLSGFTAQAQFGAPNDLAFGGSASGLTDWASRVIANGGSVPTAVSMNAMETLRTGIISAGLSNKIFDLCVFVPDSLIAATTPLFHALGSDPWTNTNFVSGDLNVNGLKGDGATKFLNTGIPIGVLTAAPRTNRGLTVLVSESENNQTGVDIGFESSAGVDPLLLNVSSNSGKTEMYVSSISGGTFATASDYRRSGVVSGNCVASVITIYGQSLLVPQQVIATLSQASISYSGTVRLFAFCYSLAGAPTSHSAKRISVISVHDGLTAAEASTFSTLLLACRTALGGGTGDEINNWAQRVVAYGGADPASGTKTALRTAYASLATAGLLTNSVALNFIVPDNLTAARMPLVWQSGAECWTNQLFGTTNLTVNGLTGDGSSKYLRTGIIPASVPANTGFSVTSGGQSLVIVTNSGSGYDFGTQSTASQQFALVNDTGVFKLYCWDFNSINNNNLAVTAPSPGVTWAGFLSGNRTAANAIALYAANTGSTFGTLTNATGTQTANLLLYTKSMLAFALGSGATEGVPIGGYSPHTVSFIGLTAGLTSAQSSNLYYIVSTARSALGGGNP